MGVGEEARSLLPRGVAEIPSADSILRSDALCGHLATADQVVDGSERDAKLACCLLRCQEVCGAHARILQTYMILRNCSYVKMDKSRRRSLGSEASGHR